MAGFRDIVGHEKIKMHLMDAIQYNKVSHAYIFNGADGIGKLMMAKSFAMALQCEAGGVEPCMECHSCKQMMTGNQPDVIYVDHEKPASIGVEDVREKLNSDILIKPYSSRYKIYIIDEAEKLTVQAQNAILKTIEEPPQYAVIMLLTNNANTFLQTILSRCTTINFKELDNELVVGYLMKNLTIPDYQAKFCAQFAGGNIGKAIALAKEGDFNSIKEDVLTVLKYSDEMQMPELVAAVKAAEKYKIDIYDYIDFIVLWFRDVLMFKATGDVNRLMYQDESSIIRKQAQHISYEGCNKVIEACDKAKARLRANVNFELAIELLLLTIKENLKS